MSLEGISLMFDTSKLVGLGPQAKWQYLLYAAHGISDRSVAREYFVRARNMDLSLEDGLVAALKIVPRDGAWEERINAGSVKRATRRLSALSGVKRAAIEASILQARVDGERTIDTCRMLGLTNSVCKTKISKVWKSYFEIPSKRSWRRMNPQIGKLDGRYLVAAYSSDLGLLTGVGIEFLGVPLENGLYTFAPGWVLFGSGAEFSSGRYELEIDLEAIDGGALLLDVTAFKGLRKIMHIHLVGSARFAARFDIDDGDKEIEVRLANVSEKAFAYRLKSILVRALGAPSAGHCGGI